MAAIALGVVALSWVRIGDADLFWHRAVGAYLLEHGRLPVEDPFSYGAEWPARYTEALAQILYALVHRFAGFEGLGALHALLLGALAGLVGCSVGGRGSVRAVVVALFAAASYAATAQKPQVFSYLCFAALLKLLAMSERGSRRAYVAIPALFAVWGYLHRAGTLGLAVLGAAALLACVRPAQRAHGRRLVLVSLVSAAALACNPGGLFYFSSTLDLASRASYRAHLADWQPLTWARALEHHLALFPLAVLAVLERLRSRRLPDAELVALVAAFVVAISGARFVPFFAIAAAAPAARLLEATVVAALRRAGDALRVGVVDALLGALAIGALFGSVLPRIPPSFFGLGIDPTLVPVHLAEVVRGVPTRGALFHAFDFGGYFVHALTPGRKVLIDGRNDTVYSDAFFAEVLAAERDPEAFARLDRRFDFRIAVVRFTAPGDGIGGFFARDPRWALVAWDDRGAVYVRRDSVSADYLEREAYRELSVETAFVRASTAPDPSDPARREADARFVAEVDRNAERAPLSARAWFVAALAHRARGEREPYLRARARLEALVAERALELPIP